MIDRARVIKLRDAVLAGADGTAELIAVAAEIVDAAQTKVDEENESVGELETARIAGLLEAAAVVLDTAEDAAEAR